MGKILTTLGSLFALADSVNAAPEEIQSSSKEMKQTVMPAPTCDFSWTGFYLGGHAGYGWGNADTHFFGTPEPPNGGGPAFTELAPTSLDPDPDGFIGGGQLGFNWQMG